MAVVNEFCGSYSSAASISASAVPSSSIHAVCNSSQTCLEPDVLVSKNIGALLILTPKLLSPLLKLGLCQGSVVRQGLLYSFPDQRLLVNDLNLGVLKVSYSKTSISTSVSWFPAPCIDHHRLLPLLLLNPRSSLSYLLTRVANFRTSDIR